MGGYSITSFALLGDVSELLNKDPVTQILALITATFISEDLTCLGSAWLSAEGRLPLWIAWIGCFSGIWMGDFGLYLIARWAGRPFTEKWLPTRWATSDSIQKAEHWIAQKGMKCLWITRFVPGTRLPTYLASGYLRMDATKFFGMTGFACLVWTSLLFWLAHRVGKELLPWLELYQWGAWLGLIGLIIAWFSTRKAWNAYLKKGKNHA